MQVLLHLLLHLAQALLHQLQHLDLALRLRLADVMQPARQPLLAFAQALHPMAQHPHLLRQWLGQPGRTGGRAGGRDQQPEHDDKHQASDQQRQNLRVIQRQGGVADPDHVRPNSRSMSESLSST